MSGRLSYGLWREVGCGLRLALAGLRDLFFVRSCAVCGKALDSDPGAAAEALCSGCLEDIPLTYFWNYSENAAMDRLAGLCHVYNAASLFFYRHDSAYCDIVRRCKYGGDIALGRWAGEMLGRQLASGGLYSGVQAIVPVPLHPLKRWRRGFNQSEIIACGIAASFPGVPVVPGLLYRRRYTATQTRKSVTERGRNVSGAFALRRRQLERLRAAGMRHILLVDDVLTTGATLSECIRLMEPFFTVSVATLGFVE